MSQKSSKDPMWSAKDPASLIDYQENSVVSRQIMGNESGTVTLFAFDYGQGLSEHTAPYDALVQVLDGKARITIGGIENNIGKGQAIIMPAGVPHELKAKARFKMLLVMIRGG